MKTIKELEVKRNKATEMSVKTFYYGRIEALKDVLGLIEKECKCCPTVRKLKKRITG